MSTFFSHTAKIIKVQGSYSIDTPAKLLVLAIKTRLLLGDLKYHRFTTNFIFPVQNYYFHELLKPTHNVALVCSLLGKPHLTMT